MSRKSSYDQRDGASTTSRPAVQEPTDAQRAWVAKLERLLGELEELEREGRRLRAARLDAPEAVLLRWLTPKMRAGYDTLMAARDLGRELQIGRDPQGCPTLQIAPPSGNVVSLLTRRQGSEQGPHE
jgi:hypothetical protein